MSKSTIDFIDANGNPRTADYRNLTCYEYGAYRRVIESLPTLDGYGHAYEPLVEWASRWDQAYVGKMLAAATAESRRGG